MHFQQYLSIPKPKYGAAVRPTQDDMRVDNHVCATKSLHVSMESTRRYCKGGNWIVNHSTPCYPPDKGSAGNPIEIPRWRRYYCHTLLIAKFGQNSNAHRGETRSTYCIGYCPQRPVGIPDRCTSSGNFRPRDRHLGPLSHLYPTCCLRNAQIHEVLRARFGQRSRAHILTCSIHPTGS